MKHKFYQIPVFLIVLTTVCLLLPDCDATNKPLDADTRQIIDSISTAQIRELRFELDSLCTSRRATELPRLIDSIKQHRLKEIEDKMRTVPKQ